MCMPRKRVASPLIVTSKCFGIQASNSSHNSLSPIGIKSSTYTGRINVFLTPLHWGRGVLETGNYIVSTFRSLAHCTQNVLDDNILSTVSQGSKCTRNVIAGFQHPSPPVRVTVRKHRSQ